VELIKDTRTATRLVVLAIIAGITSVYILQSEDPEDDNRRRGELDIAFFIKQAELQGTDDTGAIIYRVNADHAQQNPDRDDISMDTVALSYDPVAETPWDLFSDTGRIPADGKIVVLEGNVVALSNDPQEPQIKITTSLINVVPGEKRAYTNRKVVIERDGRIINGIGMEADLETNQIKLLSNVNGKYAP